MPVTCRRMLRPAGLLLAAALLAGCGGREAAEGPATLGDFRLGYNIVVARNAKKVPPSRTATAGEWKRILTEAIEKRLGRYKGDRLYHVGVNIDGYSLARAGVPVVASPKSILIFSANVYDDARGGEKLHEEPEQMSVFQNPSGETIVGSGLTQSKEEQMRELAENAAKRIEIWLSRHEEDWFTHPDPAAATAPDPAPAAAGPPPHNALDFAAAVP